MDKHLDSLFMRPQLDTSHRLSLYNQWQPLLLADGLTAVQSYLVRARAHDQHTQALEIQWRTRESKGRYGPSTVRLDNQLDHALIGTHDMAAAQMRGMAPEHPIVAAASRVLSQAFPLGVKAVVNAPYIEQAAEVERILSLFDGPLASDTVLLHLTDRVARLHELAREYRRAVDDGNQRLMFDHVQAAQARGMSYVYEILVQILAAYHDTDVPAAVASRGRYVSVLLRQENRLRAQRQARRRAAGDPSADADQDLDPADAASGDGSGDAADDGTDDSAGDATGDSAGGTADDSAGDSTGDTTDDGTDDSTGDATGDRGDGDSTDDAAGGANTDTQGGSPPIAPPSVDTAAFDRHPATDGIRAPVDDSAA